MTTPTTTPAPAKPAARKPAAKPAQPKTPAPAKPKSDGTPPPPPACVMAASIVKALRAGKQTEVTKIMDELAKAPSGHEQRISSTSAVKAATVKLDELTKK